MAADAGVALEDDVAALVDGEAVVLVVDGAARLTLASVDVCALRKRDNSPVLDGEVGRAAVEAVGVVACGLTAALGVGGVTRGWCSKEPMSIAGAFSIRRLTYSCQSSAWTSSAGRGWIRCTRGRASSGP